MQNIQTTEFEHTNSLIQYPDTKLRDSNAPEYMKKL